MDTVVMVDNDSKWIANYKRMLASFENEFVCEYFRYPEEAMEYIAAHSTAVLVSEVDMPVMSGGELFEMMDMLSPDTVRIVVTQVQDMTKVLDVLNHGRVFKLILKPFFLVEDLATPIKEGLRQYKTQNLEKEFLLRRRQEIEKLNQETQLLQKKIEMKKQGYDRICRAATAVIKGNMSAPVSDFTPEEENFVGDFCEKLLKEFIQYHMYGRQKFNMYMDDLKTQFHDPKQACSLQIYDKSGTEIPAVIMDRIAYGIFLVGFLCWQCLKCYYVEAAVEVEGDHYVLKILCQYPEYQNASKIPYPRIMTLFVRTVRELGGVISDHMVSDIKDQRAAVKLYFRS
ncbi:response regulator [Lachnospiraceae bacterium 66-29]